MKMTIYADLGDVLAFVNDSAGVLEAYLNRYDDPFVAEIQIDLETHWVSSTGGTQIQIRKK